MTESTPDFLPAGASVPCVVFDLDDTLYLERDYVHSGFQAVGAWAQSHLGLDDVADRAWSLFEGGARSRIFDTLLTQAGMEPTAAIITQMVSVYRGHVPVISALPDALACLSRLRNRVRMALITDGPPESQRRKVQALHLERYCDPIILTGLWGEAFFKPHPRAFQLVESWIGPADGRFIYVADNPRKDFIAPRARGWETVRVRRADGLHAGVEALSGCGADIELTDLTCLDDFVYRRAGIETAP